MRKKEIKTVMPNTLEQQIAQLEAQLATANAEKAKYKQLFEVSADALSIVDLSTGTFIECWGTYHQPNRP